MSTTGARGLDRFRTAQDGTYSIALAELEAGAKHGHWMWFVFPQIAGLGHSSTAQFYAVANRREAEAYLADSVLRARLTACTEAMLQWAGRRSAEAILGPVDALKFHSSMTLFAEVSGGEEPFAQALDSFFDGERDEATIELLSR
ncbi:MAG TPA: DUF1810 domain-containing protein [Croceibacterium sp.]|nr:DUF1810 domain-containing protein [Croceibacterium sp.]